MITASSGAVPWWSWPIDGWIVAVGVLAAAACAVPGSFLVLRRLSLMGDAISHAVLPGIAAAFLLTGSRAGLPMFLGAAAVGVLTALGTEWLRRHGRMEENASLGVVFTTLFAVGLVLIVRGASRVDLDPGCVLYGAIELTPLDTVTIAGWSVPRAAIVLGTVLLVNIVVVRLLWKELAFSAFDPDGAAGQGLRPGLMHAVLMTMTAVTAVAAFESVGSILVVALLVVPAASARLLTHRLGTLLPMAAACGAAAAILGHLAAIRAPALLGLGSVHTAGSIAVVAGAILVAAITIRTVRERSRRAPSGAVSAGRAAAVGGTAGRT